MRSSHPTTRLLLGSLLPLVVLGLVGLGVSPVQAWSAVGHEITATIAQIHLTPRTAARVGQLLPPETAGQLAVVASWADTIRSGRPETGPWHYINALSDNPPLTCVFGEQGWTIGGMQRNVLGSVGNWTRALQKGEGDVALRFLTHLVGDLHQPLHLTGLARGGNGYPVRFQGRQLSLHALWDGVLINRRMRELGGWTGRTGDRRLEAALRGKVYDPLVRAIVIEGIRSRWRDEWLDWPLCPDNEAETETTTAPPSSSSESIIDTHDDDDDDPSQFDGSIAAVDVAAVQVPLSPAPPPSLVPPSPAASSTLRPSQPEKKAHGLSSQSSSTPPSSGPDSSSGSSSQPLSSIRDRPLPLKPPLIDAVMDLLGLPPWLYTAVLPRSILDYTPGGQSHDRRSASSEAAAAEVTPLAPVAAEGIAAQEDGAKQAWPVDPAPAGPKGGPGTHGSGDGSSSSSSSSSMGLQGEEEGPPWIGAFPDEVERDPTAPGCPFAWAAESHPLNCRYVWPRPAPDASEDDAAAAAAVDDEEEEEEGDGSRRLLVDRLRRHTSSNGNNEGGRVEEVELELELVEELDTELYYGPIQRDWVVEKQLAKGGIRLAAILNSLFDPDHRERSSTSVLSSLSEEATEGERGEGDSQGGALPFCSAHRREG